MAQLDASEAAQLQEMINGSLDRFWSSLAFSAPELYEFHYNNLREELAVAVLQVTQGCR